jgi:GWxTD domain-containing protein
MAMKFITIILVAAVLLPLEHGLAFQVQPNKIQINDDIARFRGDSTHVYVEVYYSFDVSSMKFVPVQKGLRSEMLVNIYFVRSSNDSIVARQAWKIPFSADDSSLLQTARAYVDVAGFLVTPDIYRLYVVGDDMNDPSRSDSISSLVNIAFVDTGASALSDVELCSSIAPAEQDSSDRFFKNTFDVKPNPSMLFGTGQPVVFYYVEAYNLLSKNSSRYYTRAVIMNSLGREVMSRFQLKPRVNETSVEVGLMKVNTLPSGTYIFNFTLGDSTDGTHRTSSKRFFVYNPSIKQDTTMSGMATGVLASEYATMTEEELDREFDEARYIATSQEVAEYRQLRGVDAKRKALYDFWMTRDKNRLTPENDFKKEYMQRVDYANEHFSTGKREGWKTDRGRVFIVYGPPDEVERHANESNMKPYEVWYYNSIQGGVEFDFGDKSGFSDYILLNSTDRNELHDDNWQNQLMIQ